MTIGHYNFNRKTIEIQNVMLFGKNNKIVTFCAILAIVIAIKCSLLFHLLARSMVLTAFPITFDTIKTTLPDFLENSISISN